MAFGDEGNVHFSIMAIRMNIDEVFRMPSGRPVIIGRLVLGEIREGQQLIIRDGERTLPCRVIGLEQFGHVTSFQAGDNAALLLEGISPEDIPIGAVATEPTAKPT